GREPENPPRARRRRAGPESARTGQHLHPPPAPHRRGPPRCANPHVRRAAVSARPELTAVARTVFPAVPTRLLSHAGGSAAPVRAFLSAARTRTMVLRRPGDHPAMDRFRR